VLSPSHGDLLKSACLADSQLPSHRETAPPGGIVIAACAALTPPRKRGEIGLRSNPGEGQLQCAVQARPKQNAPEHCVKNSTDAEQKLWQRLRARQTAGLKFVRQPVGWVELCETHRFRTSDGFMGFAPLNPSYGSTAHR